MWKRGGEASPILWRWARQRKNFFQKRKNGGCVIKKSFLFDIRCICFLLPSRGQRESTATSSTDRRGIHVHGTSGGSVQNNSCDRRRRLLILAGAFPAALRRPPPRFGPRSSTRPFRHSTSPSPAPAPARRNPLGGGGPRRQVLRQDAGREERESPDQGVRRVRQAVHVAQKMGEVWGTRPPPPKTPNPRPYTLHLSP